MQFLSVWTLESTFLSWADLTLDSSERSVFFKELSTGENEQQLSGHDRIFISSLNCQKPSVWLAEWKRRRRVLWGRFIFFLKADWFSLWALAADFNAMTCLSIC